MKLVVDKSFFSLYLRLFKNTNFSIVSQTRFNTKYVFYPLSAQKPVKHIVIIFQLVQHKAGFTENHATWIITYIR